MKTTNTVTNTITNTGIENMEAEIARLRAENAKLTANLGVVASRGIKVSAKGAVSVYGLGRFPVTLYKEQFVRLLDMGDEIRSFIKANESKLSVKVKEEVTK